MLISRLLNKPFHRFSVRKSSDVKASLIPILVSVEGNIGSGKSTLLGVLRTRNPHWTFIDEPVSIWSQIKNEAGEGMLEIFYKDRRRWSYTFQNCALLTRHQQIESAVMQATKEGKISNKHIFITERCLDTDFHVFTKMLLAEGSIDSLEMDLYLRLLAQLKVTATPLSAIVHVNTHPAECSRRIKGRQRKGEESISMDYLAALDTKQRAWIDSETLPTLVTEVEDIEKVEEFIRSLLK